MKMYTMHLNLEINVYDMDIDVLNMYMKHSHIFTDTKKWTVPYAPPQ
jgi:hypothetical protein